MTVSYDEVTVDWLGYATVRLEGAGRTIYLDPGRYGVLTGAWSPDSPEAAAAHPVNEAVEPNDGDVVAVSHRHHYDPEGIERVASADAPIVAFEGIDPRNGSRNLPRFSDLGREVIRVGAEDDLLVEEVPIWTVPAYNRPDGPHTRPDGTPYHPEGRGCGFLVSLDGTRVFWPGDTDVLEGHAELDVDVFLPPIGGAFTMDRREAAALSEGMEPDLVVPIHYNTFGAIETDVEAFVEDVRERGIAVERDE